MANLDSRIAGFFGLVLFEFSQGVRWEVGVASALWGRLRRSSRKSETCRRLCIGMMSSLRCCVTISGGLARKQKRLVVSVQGSVLWGRFRGLAEKTKAHGRFCMCVCGMVHLQGA